jgi:methyl-accepting chemotaxis protein
LVTNWTIGRRLTAGFLSVITVALVLGVFAYSHLNTIEQDASDVVDDALPGIQAMGDMAALANEERAMVLEHILTADAARKAAIEKRLQASDTAVASLSAEYAKQINEEDDRASFRRIGELRRQYAEIRDRDVLPPSRAGNGADAFQAVETRMTPVFDKYVAELQRSVKFNRDSGTSFGRQIHASIDSAQLGIVIGLVIAVVVSAVLAWFITASTSRTLRASLDELTRGAQQVVAASTQVSTSAQSLSQGSTEQAASLEETSASMEEMASMTRQNAENSQEAAVLMNEVDGRVRESNVSLSDMVRSMEAIQQSSQQVGRIIKTIDEIAFQTNILALNAAVEAARAGEAGMGFAVVADEVRSLAQRSAQAAKDTAGLIEDSIAKATEGTHKVEHVAASINAITDSVTRVKGLVDGVSAASRQQAQGIDQVSQAMAQMEQVTQTTAATAEESAAASEELNAQAEASMNVVARLGRLVGSTTEPAKKPVHRHVPETVTKVVSLGAQGRKKPVVRSAEDELPLERTGTYGSF